MNSYVIEFLSQIIHIDSYVVAVWTQVFRLLTPIFVLFLIMAQKLGFTREQIHLIMQERYGKDSSKKLTKKEASDLIEFLSEIERRSKEEKEESESV